MEVFKYVTLLFIKCDKINLNSSGDSGWNVAFNTCVLELTSFMNTFEPLEFMVVQFWIRQLQDYIIRYLSSAQQGISPSMLIGRLEQENLSIEEKVAVSLSFLVYGTDFSR